MRAQGHQLGFYSRSCEFSLDHNKCEMPFRYVGLLMCLWLGIGDAIFEIAEYLRLLLRILVWCNGWMVVTVKCQKKSRKTHKVRESQLAGIKEEMGSQTQTFAGVWALQL